MIVGIVVSSICIIGAVNAIGFSIIKDAINSIETM